MRNPGYLNAETTGGQPTNRIPFPRDFKSESDQNELKINKNDRIVSSEIHEEKSTHTSRKHYWKIYRISIKKNTTEY